MSIPLSTSHIAWEPTPTYIERSHLRRFMMQHGIGTFQELLRMSTTNPAWFWDAVVEDMGLEWYQPYRQVLDLSGGIEWPRWFVGGKYNYVHDAVDKQARLRPDATAISWEGEDGEVRALTFAELHREVNQAANAIISLGVGKSDRVGIFMPMLPETAIAVLAVSKIGAIYVPIFSGFGAAAVASRLNDCSAKLLITADRYYRGGKVVPMLEVASEAAAEVQGLEHLLVVRRTKDEEPALSRAKERRTNSKPKFKIQNPTFIVWDELIQNQSVACETIRTDAEDPYMVIYTSGTTGKPKGVVHVHSGFPVKAAQEIAHCFDLHEGEVLFWISDIGWMMGPWAITGALMLGATCFLYEGAINYPQPDRVWSLVEEHRITHLGISPTAMRSLMAHGEEWVRSHDLSSLVVLAGAGEPWNPEPWQWLFNVVGGGKLPIINYSGGTEVAGGILANNPLLPIKPCAFSASVPGMAAEIVDGGGNRVKQGEVGELALRGPWPGITRGFWGDHERYLETYWSRVPGIWMHGDWARVDEDGFWYILGRSDDTIKVAGKRVGPAEVESAAVTHPAVAEAVAIGVPDEVKGEALVVLVTLRAGNEQSDRLATEIEGTIVSHLGKSLKPQAVMVVADVPRTRNGKILRRLARQAYLGESLGDTSALDNPPALEAIARSNPTNH